MNNFIYLFFKFEYLFILIIIKILENQILQALTLDFNVAE